MDKLEQAIQIMHEALADAKTEVVTTESEVTKARGRLAEAKRKVNSFQEALRALGEEPIKQQTHNFLSNNGQTKKTLNEEVIGVLKYENRPLTSRQIMDALNLKYPDKPYTFQGFSGSFAQAWTKGGIKKYTRENVPMSLKVVYGLTRWFEGDELKGEYKERILDAEVHI